MSAPLVNFLTHTTALKQLPRAGWLFAGVPSPESIADHTAATALLALMLAEAINVDPAAAGLEHALDTGRVARLALVHDLAESVTTDLPHRSVELLGEAVKQSAEEQAIAQVFADLPSGDGYRALWAEYAARSSPEARVVKDADRLEMMQQALAYERAGNRGLGEFWQEYRWFYSASARLYAALCEERAALQNI